MIAWTFLLIASTRENFCYCDPLMFLICSNLAFGWTLNNRESVKRTARACILHRGIICWNRAPEISEGLARRFFRPTGVLRRLPYQSNLRCASYTSTKAGCVITNLGDNPLFCKNSAIGNYYHSFDAMTSRSASSQQILAKQPDHRYVNLRKDNHSIFESHWIVLSLSKKSLKLD